MRYQFSDKIGRDVDGRGRGRKPSQSVPTVDEDQKLEATRASLSIQPSGQGGEGEEAAPRTNEADFVTTSPKSPGENKGQDSTPDTGAQSVQHELVKDREHTTMPEDDLRRSSGLDDIMSRLEKVFAPTQYGNAETGTGCTTSHVQQSGVARAKSLIGKKTDDALLLVDQRAPNGTQPGMTSATEKSVLEKGAPNEDPSGDSELITAANDRGTQPQKHLQPVVDVLGNSEASQLACNLETTGSISEKQDGLSNSNVLSKLLDHLAEHKARLGDSVFDVDLETEIQIATNLLERIGSECGVQGPSFLELLKKSAIEVHERDRSDIKLVANGGVLTTKFTLCESDLMPIHNFHIGNDRFVMFTLSFLTKWTAECARGSVLHNSIRTCGWWDVTLSQDNRKLTKLIEGLDRDGAYGRSSREDLWASHICFMPICGKGHWSLIVILNLNGLLDNIGKPTNTSLRRSKKVARVLFVDSLGSTSRHKCICRNLFYYLSACCPHASKPSPQSLERKVWKRHLHVQLQENMDCGFFVGYHVSLFIRVTSELERNTFRQVEVMMKELGKSYSFEAYRKDVLERLDHLLKLYNESNGIITVPIWDWSSEEHPEQDIEGCPGGETVHVEPGEVPANLHGTPKRSAMKGGDKRHSQRDGTEV